MKRIDTRREGGARQVVWLAGYVPTLASWITLASRISLRSMLLLRQYLNIPSKTKLIVQRPSVCRANLVDRLNTPSNGGGIDEL